MELFIGLMSGTSINSIDAVLVDLSDVHRCPSPDMQSFSTLIAARDADFQAETWKVGLKGVQLFS